MSTDMYAQGYSQFLKEQLPDTTIKSNPPQWRAGYRAAEKAHAQKAKIALKTEKVDRVDFSKFTVNWPVIQFVTSTPRFHCFHRDDRLYPLLSLIQHALWDNRAKMTGLKHMMSEADKRFDIILQWGFDEGILTVEDCSKHKYVPM